MNKKYLILAAFFLLLAGCNNRDRFVGYRYSPQTVSYATTATPSGGVYGTPVLIPNYNYGYNYYPYSYSTYYSSPYYYNYGYPSYRWNNGWHNWRFRNNYGCTDTGLNFSLSTPFGDETRSVASENIRAEAFGKRTEVQYGSETENLNFFTHESGRSYVSGKILVNDQLVALDPAKQKCTSFRTTHEENPDNEIAAYNCTDGTINIKAEVLIPSKADAEK